MRRKGFGHFARAEQVTLHGPPPFLVIGLAPRVVHFKIGPHAARDAGIVAEDVDRLVFEFAGERLNCGVIGDIQLVDCDPTIRIVCEQSEFVGFVRVAATRPDAPPCLIELAYPFEAEPPIGTGNKHRIHC